MGRQQKTKEPNQIKMKDIAIVLFAALIAASTPWASKREKITIHNCFIKVIDEATGKPINASVSSGFSSASGSAKNSGPQILRMTPDGMIMISWASIGLSGRKFHLTADGYVEQELSKEAVESTDGHVSIGGLEPFIIKMTPAQQVDAPEPATNASPASRPPSAPAR